MGDMDDSALRAVASPRRREILRLVWDRELSSGQIASHLDMSWPAVSQNLRVLADARPVSCRHSGTTRFYRADRRRAGPLKAAWRPMWESDLARLSDLAGGTGR